jgi:hypothetical protein
MSGRALRTGIRTGSAGARRTPRSTWRPSRSPGRGRAVRRSTCEFTSAKKSFTDAKGEVEAVDPLTVDAYQGGIDKFADGARNLAFAAQIVPTLTLPQDYKDAYPSAEHCTG